MERDEQYSRQSNETLLCGGIVRKLLTGNEGVMEWWKTVGGQWETLTKRVVMRRGQERDCRERKSSAISVAL
jgi:hypothetical protein